MGLSLVREETFHRPTEIGDLLPAYIGKWLSGVNDMVLVVGKKAESSLKLLSLYLER